METDEPITKAERADLLKIIRARERVAKNATVSRAADIKADFERQLARIYKPEDNPIWEKLHQEADRIAQQCQAQVEQRCRDPRNSRLGGARSSVVRSSDNLPRIENRKKQIEYTPEFHTLLSLLVTTFRISPAMPLQAPG